MTMARGWSRPVRRPREKTGAGVRWARHRLAPTRWMGHPR